MTALPKGPVHPAEQRHPDQRPAPPARLQVRPCQRLQRPHLGPAHVGHPPRRPRTGQLRKPVGDFAHLDRLVGHPARHRQHGRLRKPLEQRHQQIVELRRTQHGPAQPRLLDQPFHRELRPVVAERHPVHAHDRDVQEMAHPGPPRRRDQVRRRPLVTAPGGARAVHDRLHAGQRGLQTGPTRAQVHGVGGGVPAEHPHLVAVRPQPPDDEPAQRSGPAGHQGRGHVVPSLRTPGAPGRNAPPASTTPRAPGNVTSARPGGGQGPSSPPPGRPHPKRTRPAGSIEVNRSQERGPARPLGTWRPW